MSLLKFSDGEVFDTSGPLRKEERQDGWYVIGNGYLIPVASEEAADRWLLEHRQVSRL
jgi:hypothetical protein